MIALMGCVEVYQPPEIESAENLLVVDGFVNGTDGTAVVKLTRSQNVLSEETPTSESGASVTLEEEGGGTYQLFEYDPGIYIANGLALQSTSKYKLHIQTFGGRQFESDQIELRNTPPIDSITWRIGNFGLEILANTHDDTGKSLYYKWDFVETYAYSSVFESVVYFENGEVFPRNELINRCYLDVPSTKIVIGTSTKLGRDLIRDQVVTIIPPKDIRTRIRYSILVKQSALTKEAYDFWLGVQKNTQNLGTLFDPLPAQIDGNVHGVNGTTDPVLGYFYGSYVQEKRIFINSSQLPPYFFSVDNRGCVLDTVLLENLPDFHGPYLLTSPVTVGGVILIGYGFAPTYCVDCRYYGGTTQQPDYW